MPNDRYYGWEGWSREPPEYEEPPGCPECGDSMSEIVYRFDGKSMCEDCYRQNAMELLADMTTTELRELLNDEFILRENWDGN